MFVSNYFLRKMIYPSIIRRYTENNILFSPAILQTRSAHFSFATMHTTHPWFKPDQSIPKMRVQPFATTGTTSVFAGRLRIFLNPPNAQDFAAMPNCGLSGHTAKERRDAENKMWKMSDEQLAMFADYVTRGSHFTTWYQKSFSLNMVTRPDLNVTEVGNIMYIKLFGTFDQIKRHANIKASYWRDAYHAKYLPECQGCLWECCGQRDHMGPGGCLAQDALDKVENNNDKGADDKGADDLPSLTRDVDVRLNGMKRRARSLERELPVNKKTKQNESESVSVNVNLSAEFPVDW